MSCNACTKSYGFFTKEAGCPNCGFSFCTKCLKKTIAVPRLNNKPHKVCLTCFDRLTKEALAPKVPLPATAATTDEILGIDAATASADQLSDDVLQPETTDETIQRRLQRLKVDRFDDVQRPTDKDIAIRIANLKDQPYTEHPARDPSILLATDRRTDSEKTHDLLKQFEAETQLDEASDPVKDIERRLAALRGSDGGDGAAKATSSKSSPLSDDDQVKQLVARYMAEASLTIGDEEAGEIELTAEEKELVANARSTTDSFDGAKAENSRAVGAKDGEELPWCVICNEDAELRYQGDLFCRPCYREVREDE